MLSTDVPLAAGPCKGYVDAMGRPEARPVVLLVDDDEDQLVVLAAVLGADRYELVAVTSCAEGRRILAERDVDALLTDFSLGDGTALDLLLGIGSRRPRVAIVLSGFDSPADVERTRSAGYDVHLSKPTAIEPLREAIANGLREHPRSDSAPRAP